MNVVLLFLILAVACGGHCLFSCWRFPRVLCRWCGGKAPRIRSSNVRSASARTAAAMAGRTVGAPG
jgi:hypothetical protein